MKNKLTDSCGNRLLQNDLTKTICEINLECTSGSAGVPAALHPAAAMYAFGKRL
jgi:hypothetical protein